MMQHFTLRLYFPRLRLIEIWSPTREISHHISHDTDSCNKYYYFIQILMSVLLVLITVTLMLPVPTLLVASPVPVTRDTLEMESHVWVSVIIQVL
jgi:hypothetical protein